MELIFFFVTVSGKRIELIIESLEPLERKQKYQSTYSSPVRPITSKVILLSQGRILV